jgi:MFS family permease
MAGSTREDVRPEGEDAEGEEMKELIHKGQEVKDPYAPPDGGWGWVVMIASFTCNLVLDGIAYVFGIFLEPMMLHFGVSKGPMATVGSILAGTIQLSGPFVAILVERSAGAFVDSIQTYFRFGTRWVCCLGALISSAAFFASTFSPNIYVLMLLYGLVAGVGLGTMYIPAQTAVGYYFEKRRSLATGIITCGSGAGAFLLAPFAQALLTYYDGGWEGPTRIFAGLCLQCFVCGMMMRPLPKRPVVKEMDLEGRELKEPNCFMQVFRSACSPRLMTNKPFLLLCLCNLFATQGLYIPYMFLPNLATTHGVPADKASFLISIIGLSNTIARVVTGALADLPFINALVVTTIALGLGGVSCIIMIMATTYLQFVLVAVMFGVSLAAWCAVTAPSLVDILGLDLLTYAFGTLTFVRGIAALIGNTAITTPLYFMIKAESQEYFSPGPALAGFIVDATGELDWAFYIASGLLGASSFVCGLAYIAQKLGRPASAEF